MAAQRLRRQLAEAGLVGARELAEMPETPVERNGRDGLGAACLRLQRVAHPVSLSRARNATGERPRVCLKAYSSARSLTAVTRHRSDTYRRSPTCDIAKSSAILTMRLCSCLASSPRSGGRSAASRSAASSVSTSSTCAAALRSALSLKGAGSTAAASTRRLPHSNSPCTVAAFACSVSTPRGMRNSSVRCRALRCAPIYSGRSRKAMLSQPVSVTKRTWASGSMASSRPGLTGKPFAVPVACGPKVT